MTLVGSYSSPTVTVTPGDSSTGGALTIIAPDGTETAGTGEVFAVASGVASGSADPYVFTAAGLWTERWTITGTGAGVGEKTITVLMPAGTLLPDTYATSTDYAELPGVTSIPANINLLLWQASRETDDVLLTALYDPTDAAVKVALARATCEQVRWHLARGETTGLPSGYQSVTIGSVQLGRGYTSAGGESDSMLYSPIAWAVLVEAGLTGKGPIIESLRGGLLLIQTTGG